MHIKGFQGTSLLDFPGRIAALVFTGGCNLTCPFCHNPGLVLEPQQYPDYPLDELLEEIAGRRGFIDGVVISGGEPTIDPGLLPFLRELRRLQLLTKLDTNGLCPEVLDAALAEGLLDAVALDLKTDPSRYPQLHHGPVAVNNLLRSLTLLRSARITLEVRTTCVPGWIDAEDLHAIGRAIRGVPTWALQQFHGRHALDPALHDRPPYPRETLESFRQIAAEYVDTVQLRGI